LLGAAALLSLAWAAWVAMALGSGVDPRALAPRDAIRLAADLLVVPALLFALAAALRGPPSDRPPETPDGLLDGAELAEARTVGLATRLSQLRDQLAADAAAADAATRTIEGRAAKISTAIGEVAKGADRLAAIVADVSEATAAVAMRAGEAEAGLRALLEGARAGDERLRAGLARFGAEAGTAAAAAAAAARGIDEATATLREEAGTRIADMGATINAIGSDAARILAETRAATAATGDDLAAQSEAIARATAASRAALAQIGTEAARTIGRHLEGLVAQARELEARIAAQAQATETLASGGERAFQLLDTRLEHSTRTTAATIASLDERLTATHGLIDALAEPVRAAKAAVADLDAATKALREEALSALDVVGGALSSETGRLRADAQALGTDVERVAAALAAATEGARGLAEPVAASEAAIEAAARRFAEQREAVGHAGAALVVELEQARQLIAEVEKATEATSLAAATRLVDALSRVREVSSQATGTMRAMLDGLVAEARESLGTAAHEALAAGFVEPIAREAGAAEARARAAAERSAASLAALAGTLQLVEERSGATSAALARAEEADLAATAEFLLQRLAAESVSIASALGRPMEADDWARWRKGERSLFNRRLVQLLERSEEGALRALLARDEAVAAAARRYVGGFDSLLARIEARGEATLAALLRSSDSGRLAGALSEALAG
jgi:hypothetical protein